MSQGWIQWLKPEMELRDGARLVAGVRAQVEPGLEPGLKLGLGPIWEPELKPKFKLGLVEQGMKPNLKCSEIWVEGKVGSLAGAKINPGLDLLWVGAVLG